MAASAAAKVPGADRLRSRGRDRCQAGDKNKNLRESHNAQVTIPARRPESRERARGDERPDSDLDVMIEYDSARPFTLFDMVAIKRYLEELTDLEIHLATRDAFPSARLRRVLKHSVDVF